MSAATLTAPVETLPSASTTSAKTPAIKVGNVTYLAIPVDPSDPASKVLYIEEIRAKLIVSFMKRGTPVAILGEAGSGKTELARALMKRLKPDEFYQMEFGAITSGDQLDGDMILEAGPTGTKTTHVPSEHLKAVRSAHAGKKVGYVLDELNRASMFGINKMLRLYAQWEYVSNLDGVFNIKPENLVSVATLNVGFGFSGTNKVDKAVADRFRCIRLAPPPAEILSRILNERFPGINADAVKGIVKIFNASRQSSDGYALGVRDALGLAEGVHYAGIDLIQAVEILVDGSAYLEGVPQEATEALIATAKSAVK